MLTIWGRANSINVMKTLWTCAELGVDYVRIDAGAEHGRLDETQFLEMNPNGRVPVINDDGFMLWESNVIVRYLAYKYGLGTLYPSDMRKRAEAEQWMEWQQTTVSPPLAWPFQGLVRRDPAFADPARIEHAARELNRVFGILDRHLAGSDFMMGNQFTMADIPLGAAAHRWFALAITRAEVPHVTAWYGRLAQREAFATHVMVPLS